MTLQRITPSVAEGEADKKLWGKLTALGSITVKVYRVRFENLPPASASAEAFQYSDPRTEEENSSGHQSKSTSQERLESQVLQNDRVPEKNLKGRALSHQAK